MIAHLKLGKQTLVRYAGPASKALIDSKPIGSELAAAYGLNGAESQFLVDKMAACRYLARNRTRHASPRCAPGGTFFAQDNRSTCGRLALTGMAVQP